MVARPQHAPFPGSPELAYVLIKNLAAPVRQGAVQVGSRMGLEVWDRYQPGRSKAPNWPQTIIRGESLIQLKWVL